MKNDENLIFEKYVKMTLKEGFSSNINRKGQYAIWGFGLEDDSIGEGSDKSDYMDTVENMLWGELMGDTSMTDVMGDMGYETSQDKDQDIRMSDTIVESIGCTLDDDPLLIKGKYEAAIAYRIRLNAALPNNVYVVTDDNRFSTWKLADENFAELKNIAINSLQKLKSAGKSNDKFIPGINYTGIMHFFN